MMIDDSWGESYAYKMCKLDLVPGNVLLDRLSVSDIIADRTSLTPDRALCNDVKYGSNKYAPPNSVSTAR